MRKQLVPVRFLGLDQGEAKGFRVPGTLEAVENYYYSKGSDGGLELRKRAGSVALGRALADGGTITAGRRLEVIGDSLYQLSTVSNRRYDVICGWDRTANQWYNTRQVAPFAFSTTPISVDSSATTGGYQYVDAAYGGGYAVFAYVTGVGGGLKFRVIEYASGKQVDIESSQAIAGTYSRGLRIVYTGASFLAFLITSGNNLVCYELDTTQPRWPLIIAAPTTVGAVVAGGLFDVTKVATDSLLIAYRPTATDVTVVKWSSGMASLGSTTTAIGANQALGWLERENYNDGNAYLAVIDSVAGARLYSMTTAGITPVLHSTIDATATSASGVTGYNNVTASEFVAMWHINTALAQDAVTKIATYASGVWTVGQNYGVTIAAKPILVAGQWHWLAAYETNSTATTTQNTYLLVSGDDSVGSGAPPLYSSILGVHLPGEGGGHIPNTMTIPGSWMIDSTHVMFPTRRRARLVSNGSSSQYASRGPQMLVVDSSPAAAVGPSAILSRAAVMPGCMIRSLGNNDAPGLGFVIGPEKPTVAAAGGGLLTQNGTYSFVIAYERYTPQGERLFSAISEPSTITLSGANRSVTLGWQNLAADTSFGESSGCKIRVFRTQNGQELYYRSTVNDSYDNNLAGGVTAAYTDTEADTTIANNEPVYTDSGELDSEAPPASRVACVWKNRVWLAGCERDDEIWASKEIERDVGVGFSKGLVVRIERDGGDVTALVPLEDRLLVLKRASAYIITGDGPDAAGAGQMWQITKLPLQVGTIYPRSCVYYSGGVVFKSALGWFALSRGLEPQYIGGPVEDYNSLDCTGAVVEEDKNHIRFFSSSGRELVYNWLFGRWSTYTGHPAVAACKWQNKVTWLASDGTVYQDSASVYTDNAVSYTATATMNFASFAGINGFQRVSGAVISGETLNGAAYLNITYTTDHGVSGTTVTETFQTSVNPGRAVEIQPRVRRCTAVRLSISDPASNAGFALRAVSFWLGISEGSDRLLNLQRRGPV